MKANYQELIRQIGEENFTSRFDELLKQIRTFLEEAKYDESVRCNERILYHVLLDYYSDIVRLKEFHNITNIKTDKLISYLLFWFLKRKPIQLEKFSDKESFLYTLNRSRD